MVMVGIVVEKQQAVGKGEGENMWGNSKVAGG